MTAFTSTQTRMPALTAVISAHRAHGRSLARVSEWKNDHKALCSLHRIRAVWRKDLRRSPAITPRVHLLTPTGAKFFVHDLALHMQTHKYWHDQAQNSGCRYKFACSDCGQTVVKNIPFVRAAQWRATAANLHTAVCTGAKPTWFRHLIRILAWN